MVNFDDENWDPRSDDDYDDFESYGWQQDVPFAPMYPYGLVAQLMPPLLPFPGFGDDRFGQQQQGPSSPPPNFIPEYSVQPFAVDPGAIRRCLFRFTYVWLSRRESFWFFPTFVGRNSVAGFRWNERRRRWQYFGIDLDRIDSFTCF